VKVSEELICLFLLGHVSAQRPHSLTNCS